MLRFVLFVCILAGAVSSSIFSQPEEKKEVPQVKVTDRCLQLYREMDLEGRVNYAAFRQTRILRQWNGLIEGNGLYGA